MSELVSVTAEDGYPLRHRVWPSDQKRGTVIAWNGVMSHSAWLAPIAELIQRDGFTFVGADRRGSGENSSARGDAPSADVLIDDALRIVRHHESDNLFLLGWCWGAALALNVIRTSKRSAQRAERAETGGRASPDRDPSGTAKGLILIAPGLWPTAAVERAAKAADVARGARDDEASVSTPIAEEMFTRGPMLERIRNDELRLLAVTPRFRKIMGRLAITAVAGLRRIEAPMLVILANEDEATDSDAAERALSSATVVRLAGPHGLMFERPQELAAAILLWIEERL